MQGGENTDRSKRQAMERRFAEALREDCGVEPGDAVIAAVSGGADSMCLLLLLLRARVWLPMELSVVHVHHGIRGEEADADAQAVAAFCRDRGISCRVFEEDVPGIARRSGMSEEEAGREVRRRILKEERERRKEERACREVWVALAHHREDQAETVLMHLVRGSGLHGLGGMSCRDGYRIRPLLWAHREEIENYLTEEGVIWREDATNASDAYTRNRIRHHLLPWMREHLNPAAAEHLAETAEELREADQYLETMALSWLSDHQQEDLPGELRLPAGDLEALHPALRRRVLWEALCSMAGRRKDIGRVHVGILEDLLKGHAGRRADLPYGLTAGKHSRELFIRNGAGEKEKGDGLSEEVCISLREGERITFRTADGIQYSISVFARENGQKIPEKRYTKWMDYDRMGQNIVLRHKQTGDVIELAGVGEKKLGRYMIDAGIPREERGRIPLLADGNRILWIIGYRLGAGTMIRDDTKTVLEVRAELPMQQKGKTDE